MSACSASSDFSMNFTTSTTDHVLGGEVEQTCGDWLASVKTVKKFVNTLTIFTGNIKILSKFNSRPTKLVPRVSRLTAHLTALGAGKMSFNWTNQLQLQVKPVLPSATFPALFTFSPATTLTGSKPTSYGRIIISRAIRGDNLVLPSSSIVILGCLVTGCCSSGALYGPLFSEPAVLFFAATMVVSGRTVFRLDAKSSIKLKLGHWIHRVASWWNILW